MKYRTDIDGLRALAVVPVVLFHLDIVGFSGGYVGVDIFFVISGYLITGLIAADIRHGRFTIANFYERRIRRIFPALFFMLACVLVAGLLLFMPQDVRSLNTSVAATALFVSNIHLWLNSGYFAKAAELQPLLHTWSLAVEEQFYIVFPIFLAATWRWGRHSRHLIWLALLGSLALSIYGVRYHAEATFYFLPTRAWELLIGSVIALQAVPRIDRPRLNEVLALAGLALILFAVFVYRPTTRFPGEAALMPCLGAGLIIYAGMHGSETLVGRLLSTRVMVFIGLISYSLYLWHWPLIVFAKYLNVVELTPRQVTFILFAAVAIATLSWRCVERPFRRHGSAVVPTPSWRWLPNRAVAYGVLTIVVCVGVCASGSVVYSNERALRALYSERVYRYDLETQIIKSAAECVGNGAAALTEHCLLGDARVAPTVALWGDSFADSLQESLSLELRTAGLSAGRFVLHSCPSILNTQVHREDDKRLTARCEQFNRSTFDTLTHNAAIRTVVLFDNYLWYLEPRQPMPLLMPTQRAYANDAERQRIVIDELLSTIRGLAARGKRVVIIGAYPKGAGANVIARTLAYGGDVARVVNIARHDYDGKIMAINNELRGVSGGSIVFIDPSLLFCRDDRAAQCSFLQHDLPMLSDGNHLSAAGAADLSGLIAAAITTPAAPLDKESILASAASAAPSSVSH